MSEIKQTAEEVFDSVTGFDEIAIAQQFGRTVGELAEKDQSMFGRALVFVVKRRDGASDGDAYQAALGMSVKELTSSFFAEASEEEAGKGEPLAEQPEASLSSVS